jgi:hypothetical protein
MASFPTCETPSNLAVTNTSNSFTIAWDGSATTYKLAYRLENVGAWIIQSKTGPGSGGGSGVNNDDTGGAIIPTSPVSSANFTASGLTPGVYDIRAINICQDGSVYIRKIKVAIEENVGSIPNLRLQSDPGGNYKINIEWDAPTIDSGNPIIVSWCKINRFGQKIDCSSDEVPPATTQYSIFNPGPDLTMIWVAQKAANGFQYSVSNALYIEGTPCEDDGCIYEPITLESESSI